MKCSSRLSSIHGVLRLHHENTDHPGRRRIKSRLDIETYTHAYDYSHAGIAIKTSNFKFVGCRMPTTLHLKFKFNNTVSIWFGSESSRRQESTASHPHYRHGNEHYHTGTKMKTNKRINLVKPARDSHDWNSKEKREYHPSQLLHGKLL